MVDGIDGVEKPTTGAGTGVEETASGAVVAARGLSVVFGLFAERRGFSEADVSIEMLPRFCTACEVGVSLS